ncbi:hypothetical protein DV735_g810, partial [Chaetothyriales sp. CBS 134920]
MDLLGPTGILNVLGSGRDGVVYASRSCAIKQIKDKEAFEAEAAAYRTLSQDRRLRGRIPKLYGIDAKTQRIYLQRIRLPTLRKKLPDEATLVRIRDYLLKTVKIIHECGWCHTDISLDNVFSSGRLCDFSNAYPKTKLSARAWERFQTWDRDFVQGCYREALALKKLETVKAFLASHTAIDSPERQAELAKLLRPSASSPTLLKKLERISHPIPALALEICALFRLEGKQHIGKLLLPAYNLPRPCDDESRLLFVRIKTELAFCAYASLDNTGSFLQTSERFTDAIQSSIALLGRTSNRTIELRARFAKALSRFSLHSDALEVLNALNIDCEGVSHSWNAEKRTSGRIEQSV